MPSPRDSTELAEVSGVGMNCGNEHAYGTMLRTVPAPESMPPITSHKTKH